MKRLLFKLTVLVALVLNGFSCIAQPEFSGTVALGPSYMPINIEDESGVYAKTKRSWGVAGYGSVGIDFPNMPFEIYADLYARSKFFKTKLPCEVDYVRNILLTLNPGFGIRLYMSRKWDATPIFEVGINYDLALYKGFYGWDKNQINRGVNNTFGIGVYDDDEEDGWVFVVEIPNKNSFFNKEYTSDGGYYYPYANIKDNIFPTFWIKKFFKF